MIRIFLIPILISLSFLSSDGYSQDFFEQTDAFLTKNVQDGKVAYASINQQSIEDLLQQIRSFQLTNDKSTDLAFYINAYNILVIHSVLQSGSIKSPLDVDGFFDKRSHAVAGQSLTLNQIENEIIRPTYQDARIHFALVCGALGCPRIQSKAFKPQTLDQQLAESSRIALNDPNFVRVSNDQKKVELSEIFKWYAEDFGADINAAVSYINQFRSIPIPSSYSADFYTYDWTLNGL